MARTQRAPNTRARDVDFSNVGTTGRRTGLTLPQQKLDEHGLEEVSNLFSSPKKPSPLKQMFTAADVADEGESESMAMTGRDSSGMTPAQVLSTRRSLRASLPRSVSPRKSGISGTARRSGALRATDHELENALDEDDADDEAPVSSPSRANQAARRRSSSARDASPLRDITARNGSTPASRRGKEKLATDGYSVMTSIENGYPASEPEEDQEEEDNEPQHFVDAAMEIDDYNGEPVEEEDIEVEHDAASVEPPPQIDDEDADQTFTLKDGRGKTTANSRRKRKSDGEPSAPPASKKARKDTTKKGTRQSIGHDSEAEAPPVMPPPNSRGRPPLKKDNKSKMSKRQEKELDEMVEKVRARPNPPRSLYILRKETPADDDATITRSGRMSVKPLAYWRNERCVWGGSPQSELKNGARFPLNSIKEIIRTEEHYSPRLSRKSRKGKGKGKAKATAKDGVEEDGESSSDEDQPKGWEVDSGTVRGKVSEWDSEQGAPLDVEQEIDIAHSSGAIQTYAPAAKTGKEQPRFKYSKLFSNEFLSVGLVDLPPGGEKKPKNAQKMQMTFYVIKGRVTASVGPVFGEMTTFSIGKGGFWQVPRGNQYAIENELGTEARLVFCQGCEVIPEAFLFDEEEQE